MYRFLFIFCFISFVSCKNQPEKPNVLFIMVDDLRPELGCYGNQEILSPNIDALAKNAITFNNAYCNIPVCGASRASLLTGILPTKTRFVQYNAKASEDAPNAKTLPQVFKESGYDTFSIGKVFHHIDDTNDKSWTAPAWRNQGDNYNFMQSLDSSTTKKLSKRNRGRIFEMPNVTDDKYNDGQTALKTIELLKKYKKSNTPFFIASGFVRPHLPFYAPKKYWDLYNRDSISMAKNTDRPKNAPKSLHGSGEFRQYHFAGLKPKNEDFKRMMKHGYYASVSYTDKLIGDIVEELKKLELDKNTIIVLWGDHGWQLGEHNYWGKHNTLKVSLRVPLIIKVPGKTKTINHTAIVESTDLFPTICDLADVNLPKNQLQGKSFKNILNKPKASFRDFAYSRFLSGDAIVTNRFAYTHYTGKRDEIMLFDHKNDPDENENVVENPKYKTIIDTLETYLKASKNRAIIK